MTSARSRERLIETIRARDIADERVLDAMAQVPRHEFVDEAMASHAYDDTALPIGYGQTISQPSIVAEMSSMLIEDGVPDRVLEIGTGSGYQAAVLAELGAAVYTVERIEPLHRRARERLLRLGYRSVRARLADDDAIGLAVQAPFDAIVVTAGAAAFPDSLLEQLADNGVVVIPVGGPDGRQRLHVLRARDGEYQDTARTPVVFVPLIADELDRR